MRYAELLTYRDSGRILDFNMSRNGASPLRCRIFVPSVTGTFLEKDTSVFFKMADQVPAFHLLSNFHAHLFPLDLFSLEVILGN